ncbi:ribosome biogenesis GTP-binding protein YihA/YsxC [Desulfoferrobacter suflitae]|uniref:ribosome biogenesis GTP-binding protein YihA/YsxC n=1 Tax=Desulfoferrobacter suflitae TaxID=2865782 RepID=UPI00216462EF|nr:ribosome biogenesis GTP-binding protein YihA/YsxC [Desulfoferrobacter suflitae]MCK8600892.1 ribosome biogenesis GTP-binding protein YihA/YsxC [Desulfoferrobacter suflitae]
MSRDLIIKSADYVASAVTPEQCPAEALPEVAFAGRSNVGKSSLINCLVRRKKLVRTSRTPGRTQTINFFIINAAFYFVDLPGYGFARVPESVRAQWGPMVESYLGGRRSLRGVVQIMDARRAPTADDLQLWNWLRVKGIAALGVLTKSDKLPRGKHKTCVMRAAQSLTVAGDDLILFSAVNHQGRNELLERLASWLLPHE